MNTLHYKYLLKYSLIILIIYNLFSLFILFNPIKSLKNALWILTPYDYSFGMKFPNNLEKKSLLNETNRDELSSFLDKNINRNLLNINYWNKKLIIDSYSKQENNDFEKSFMNLFILTKNNKQKNLDLKKYFVVNYNYFSEENKKKILENYN
jgi:hypothetical protein